MISIRGRRNGATVSAHAERVGVVGWLGVLALACGALQSIVTSVWPVVESKLLDDAAVFLLAGALLFRIRGSRLWPLLLIAAWAAIGALALMHSETPLSTSVLMYRQILMPAVLIYCGLLLTPAEWKLLVRVGIGIAVLCCLYVPLDLAGIRPFDLAALNSADPLGARGLRDGDAPGSFWYYWGDSGDQRIPRAGGIFLNPPVMGIAVGTAFALAGTLSLRRRFKIPLMIVLGVGTAFTFSRAGILIAALGVVLPWLLRRLGVLWSGVLVGLTAFAAYFLISEHGKSVRHVDGLIQGLQDSFTTPWGMGYGNVGNNAKRLGQTLSGESLLGIAFSSSGVIAVAIVALLALTLIINSLRNTQRTLSCIALSGLAAAALSESAGALNGSMLLWMACGVAIGHSPRLSIESVKTALTRRTPSDAPGEHQAAASRAH